MGILDKIVGQSAAGDVPPSNVLGRFLGASDSDSSPAIVARGDILPISRDEKGGVHFDPTAGVLGSLVRSAMLPGDVYAGKVDPLSEQGVARAAEMAANLGSGGLATPKPAGAVGIFGGALSKTANHAVADLTEQALARGATDRQAYEAGGWFKGVDGKMRYEIPDHEAVLRPGEGVSTVGQRLDHPALFAAYPELANIQLRAVDLGPGSRGYNAGAEIGINSTLSPSEQTGALLHELQHQIQRRENFAHGGSPIDAMGAAPDEVMSLYRGQAGEVEARNVQARQAMTPTERSNRPPWETMDTPAINQAVHFDPYGQTTTGVQPPRLANDAPMTADQMRNWMRGEYQPGAPRSGFFYHDLPDVMANPAHRPAAPAVRASDAWDLPTY